MTLTIRHFNLPNDSRLAALIEDRLRRLGRLVRIGSATIRVEHRRDAAPPIHIHAHLEIPGPDLRAAGADHTGPAAWLKVLRTLERQIAHRLAKRTEGSRDSAKRCRLLPPASAGSR